MRFTPNRYLSPRGEDFGVREEHGFQCECENMEWGIMYGGSANFNVTIKILLVPPTLPLPVPLLCPPAPQMIKSDLSLTRKI